MDWEIELFTDSIGNDRRAEIGKGGFKRKKRESPIHPTTFHIRGTDFTSILPVLHKSKGRLAVFSLHFLGNHTSNK